MTGTMKQKAGIIGGTGKMGRLFAKVFENAGYEVLVSGRKTAKHEGMNPSGEKVGVSSF